MSEDPRRQAGRDHDRRPGARCSRRSRRSRVGGPSCWSTAAASASPSGSSASASRRSSRAACGSPTPQRLEVAAAVLRGVVNSELVAGLRDLGVDAVGPVRRRRRPADRRADPGARPRRARRRAPARPPRRDPRRRPGAGRRATGARRGRHRVQRQRRRRGRGHRGGPRCAPARPAHRRRWRPRRRRPAARHAHRRRGGALIETGVIAGGMVPKVRAALAALGWDGAEAIIADSSARRRPRARARRSVLRDADHRDAGPRRRWAPHDPASQELKRLRQRAIRQLVASPTGRQPARARRRADRAGLRRHPGHDQPRHHRARPAQGRRARTATSTSR